MIKLKYILKILFTSIYLSILMGISLYPQTVVDPTLTLNTPGIADQDDMCIWIHQNNKSLSIIVTSDKGANKLFVYDLSGNVLQTIDVPGKPGNIDIRYNFMISGVPTDIVGYNDRTNGTIVFYKVDRTTRELSFLSNFSDGGMTGNNYGFCLYRSLMTDKYYAIASSKSTQMKQWELVDNGDGTIGGSLKRSWNNGSGGITEGMVADDELGILYAANEGEGIYKYNAEPNDPNPVGELIAPTGVNGLTADVEGITIYYASQGSGYLMASSQGSDNFKVYERQAPHNFVKTVEVTGVGNTDGIDVTNFSLGPSFPLGLFLVHDGTGSPYVIRGCKWEDLGLEIDTTYWDPTDILNSPTYRSPKDFALYQNYPNPYNPVTTISYSLPLKSQVELILYNTLGESIKHLVSGEKEAGSYEVEFNATGLPSGIYFYRIQAGDYIETKKMVLLR